MTFTGARIWRHALLLSAVATLLLFGISLLLITWRVEQMLSDLALQQSVRTASNVHQSAEQGIRLGIALEDQAPLEGQLHALFSSEKAIAGIQLLTTHQHSLVDIGATQVPSHLWNTEKTGHSSGEHVVVRQGSQAWIYEQIVDAAGMNAGALVMAFDYHHAQQQARLLGLKTITHTWPLILACIFFLAWTLREHLSPEPLHHQSKWKYLATACCFLSFVATPLAVLWNAREAAKPLVYEQIENNAGSLGSRLANELERALDAGIPYPALPGIAPWLAQAQKKATEISSIHVGETHSLLPDEAVIVQSKHPGYVIALTYPNDFVDQQLSSILVDLILAVVISAFLVYEISRGRWKKLWEIKHSKGVWDPHAHDAREKSRNLSRIRLFIFLVALSEELLRPFLTVFASQLDSSLNSDLSAGLPVAAFMLTLAIAQPLGPLLAQHADLRKLMIATALLGTFMLAMSAGSQSITTLVVWRAGAGMAYGLGLILAQTAIVRITARQKRAQGMTSVAAAIVAAGIVGPPFGGMIAAQMGPQIAFMGCAICMCVAITAIWKVQNLTHEQALPSKTPHYSWQTYLDIWREPRAIAVILGSALPARLAAVGLLSILIPLYASDLQVASAVTGRVLLLYFLVFALSVGACAQWSDKTGNRLSVIIAGGLASAAACACAALVDGIWGLALCSALLGLGQAMQSSPQVALITEAFEDSPERLATPEQALAAFRLLERAGSVLAPFVIVAAIHVWGYAGAITSLGVFLLFTTLCMHVLLKARHTSTRKAGSLA